MEIKAVHRFPAEPLRVLEAMTEPAVAWRLATIPDVAAAEVVDHGDDGVVSWLAVRLTYGGSLDPLAAKVLGSERPSWVQSYRLDRSSTTGTLTISPDHHASLLECQANVELRLVNGHTERQMLGALRVRIPLVGPRAERALVPAVTARIDAEAALVTEWLTRG